MAIVKISDLPLVDSPVEGTDLFVVVQDNVTKKAYASDIQTYVGFEEVQTATAGQTVFNLTTMTYAAGANNLMVFVDGVNQYEGSSYQETDNNTVTFSQGLHEGALVKFSTVQTQTSLVNNAGAVTFLQAGTGAVPRSVQSKERDIVSVKDFGAVGDGVTDDTAAIQAACAYIQSRGGGCLDFGGANDVYSVFNGTYSGAVVYPAAGFSEVARLGNFSGLDGVEIRSAGAKIISNGSFPIANRRITLFYFLNCNNVSIGDFTCDYTGNRGYPADGNALFTRGLNFAFFQGNCSNISGGNLIADNFSFGWAFQAISQGVNLDIESRNVNIDSIKCFSTGYAYFCNGGGHSANVGIVDTDECGRSCTLQDVRNGFNITVKSKNHQSSADCGLSGWSDGGYFKYINIESDAGIELGRCVGINFPLLADSPNRVFKNVTIDLDISATGSTWFSRAFTCGLGVGVSSGSIDPAFILDGLTVTGRIYSATTAMQPIVFDYPSSWSLGQNLYNINVQNVSIPYDGISSFDLRGLATTANISNFRCNTSMQLQGNTIGQIVCVNCIALTPYATGSASNNTNISFVNCRFTDDFTIVPSKKILSATAVENRTTTTNVWMNGIYQVFTLAITNDGGTLKHKIIGDYANEVFPRSCTRISGASSTLASTPTVNNTTGFVSGVGIVGGFINQIAFNTEDQTAYTQGINLAAFVERYDGNVSVPSVSAIRNSVNVNGSTISRVHLAFFDALSGAAWDINTTNIPSGKTIWVKFLGYII